MRRLAPFFIISALVATPVAAQLAPASAGSVADLDRALRRLTANKRILVIGAHPDDEDTQTLTYVSLAMGGEAAYLSLTRGEGGQNAIGPELGVGLGIIRSEELLAARRIDGARQYFTRAFDFGFSKSAEETYRFWPHDSLLADVIAVIRRFRPQIIVTVFSGTPRDGHGQHQVSGLLAREAFDRLSREPGGAGGGPQKLYRRTFFDTANSTLALPTGTLDPAVGVSYQQIAMLSRSQHRSQDFGRLLDIGPANARLAFTASAAAGANGPPPGDALFAGVDTTLPGLDRFVRLVDSARALLSPRDPSRIVPLLVEALAELRRRGGSLPVYALTEKERVLQEALAAAAGVVVDARTDRGALVPGQTLRVTASLWRAGAPALRHVKLEISAPSGWTTRCPERSGDVAPGILLNAPCEVTVPPAAPPTQPYFLARPMQGALYDWTGVPDDLRGEPFEPPLLTARFTLEIAGATVTLTREVTHRTNESSGGGERRWPLRVVPPVAVSVVPSVLVWPLEAAGGREVTVTLTQGDSAASAGEVGLDLPPGWSAVPAARYALGPAGSRRSVRFTLRQPANLRPGTFPLRAYALQGGQRLDQGLEPVSYPHIRPRQLVRPATVEVRAASVAMPSLRRVGYVRGGADMVPEALTQLGVPVELLDAEVLERADLSGYDAIVIGSRAYETEPALAPNNARLLEYARGGGLVIVQYQQYEFVRGNFAPFPLDIARPHDRVTDELAPVRVLDPQSRVVTTPNRIGPADWDGWVQERGLYFAHTWDSTYTAVLEMSDPGGGGAPLRGGLLIAPVGRGTYVYTGLAFFRQLPAGVPGAYRLFLNLLGLKGGNVQ